MVTVHSLVRWLVLLGAVAALAGYARAVARSRMDGLAERLGALYTTLLGVQFLVGLIVWLIERRWNGEDVFFSFIHPLLMLIGISIASAGTARARRTGSAVVGLVAVLVSLVVIVLAIPRGSWTL
jgi:vacuolar-type H+-ATPase subunit I/STV1